MRFNAYDFNLSSYENAKNQIKANAVTGVNKLSRFDSRLLGFSKLNPNQSYYKNIREPKIVSHPLDVDDTLVVDSRLYDVGVQPIEDDGLPEFIDDNSKDTSHLLELDLTSNVGYHESPRTFNSIGPIEILPAMQLYKRALNNSKSSFLYGYDDVKADRTLEVTMIQDLIDEVNASTICTVITTGETVEPSATYEEGLVNKFKLSAHVVFTLDDTIENYQTPDRQFYNGTVNNLVDDLQFGTIEQGLQGSLTQYDTYLKVDSAGSATAVNRNINVTYLPPILRAYELAPTKTVSTYVDNFIEGTNSVQTVYRYQLLQQLGKDLSDAFASYGGILRVYSLHPKNLILRQLQLMKAQAELSLTVLEEAEANEVVEWLDEQVGLEEVAGIVSSEVLTMNISFRLDLGNNIDAYNDTGQPAVTREELIELNEVFPNWWEYCYMVGEPTNDSFADPSVQDQRSYLPKYTKLLNEQPPHRIMALLGLMFKLNVHGEQPDVEWYQTPLFQVAVTIILTAFTISSLGTAYPLTSAAIVFLTTVKVISILNRDTTTAALADKALALVGVVSGVASTLSGGLTLGSGLSYGLQIANMALQHTSKQDMNNARKQLKDIQAEIDAENEIITAMDKVQKVKDYIYTDSHDDRYSYDKLYNYSSIYGI